MDVRKAAMRRLSPDEAQVLVARYGTKRATARALGIGNRTLDRWLDPAVMAQDLKANTIRNSSAEGKAARAARKRWLLANDPVWAEHRRALHRQWLAHRRATDPNHRANRNAYLRRWRFDPKNADKVRAQQHRNSLAVRRRRLEAKHPNGLPDFSELLPGLATNQQED